MNIEKCVTDAGVSIRYAVQELPSSSPWLVLIFPFGLKVEFAEVFFDHFGGQYSLVCCESRLVFHDIDKQVGKEAFQIQEHVSDVDAVCKLLGIDKATLVGYCSGAGVALSLVNKFPGRFEQLLLVHGEYAMLGRDDCVTQIGKDIDSLLPLAGMNLDSAQMIMQSLNSHAKASTDDISGHADMNLPYTDPRFLFRYANSYMAYRTVDFEERAKQIPLKTFVMTGHQDSHTNVNSSTAIHQCLPDSEIYIDDDADHYGILRKDSNTLNQIECFLADEL